MSFTLTSSGAILMKAGANVDSTAAASGALIKEACDQAEAIVCATTRYDWVTNYSSLNANFKKILDVCVASWAGNEIVKYNPFAYFSLTEAQTIINVNYDNYVNNLQLLRNEAEVRTAIGGS